MQSAIILIHQLCYCVSVEKQLFQNLSLALGNERTGLIGVNGAGKSTLLHLIAGTLTPDQGSIQLNGKIEYCSQLISPHHKTVADLLSISEKWEAFKRIASGSLDEKDFNLLGEDWSLEQRAEDALADFKLNHISLDTPINQLSGGEKTRVQLAKVFFSQPDFIILDEPTNHLDLPAREYFYERIRHWEKGLLIASHDRTLLNLMDQIVELTPPKANIFGGNYEHYQEQKLLIRDAAEREWQDAKKALHKTQKSIQTSRERHEQKSSQGRELFLSGKIDRLFANSQRGKSEKSQSRMTKQKEHLTENAEKRVETARSKIEILKKIDIEMPATFVPNGKLVLELERVSFHYELGMPLIQDLDLSIVGPERIAIMGPNGSGKTTLIKLILDQLKPTSGCIYRGIDQIHYLSQEMCALDPEKSIIDNFLAFNPDAKLGEAHHVLAKFLFRNASAHQLVKHLSGGEKMRASLACILMAKSPPQLLILDEPTNHLDIDSVENIEAALACYQGALITISHDEVFLNNIQIQKWINTIEW